MELKNYFAQDVAGNVLPGAECSVFFPGTTERVTTLENANGGPRSNPFFADSRGLIQFAAPNGRYDLQVKSGALSYTIRVQCADIADFAADLANTTDPAKGAAMVGRGVVAVDTVADLLTLPAEVLREDLRYSTAGYHSKGDGGGAIYSISPTDPGYGIPLHNGMFLLFDDAFDVRKFGILDDETLDQTERLKRLVDYADKFVYEVDFHGMSIQTPNIRAFVTAQGTDKRGLLFRKFHKLKNLRISNPKNTTLTQGWSCILFCPTTTDYGHFILENVIFDPYSPDFSLTSGQEDGGLHGFSVSPEGVSKYECNFDITLKDIHFESPAISYNTYLHGSFNNRVVAENLTGDYWGLYLLPWAKELYANNVHGTFRDDLHSGSGRTLVTSLIHYEAETTGVPIDLDRWEIRNVSVFHKTTGNLGTAVKVHLASDTAWSEFIVDDVDGKVELYSNNKNGKSIGRLTLNNIRVYMPMLTYPIDNVLVSNSTITTHGGTYLGLLPGSAHTYQEIVFADCSLGPIALSIPESSAAHIANLRFLRCTLSNSATNGTIRTLGLQLDRLEAEQCEFPSSRFIECIAGEVYINGGKLTAATAPANFIFIRGSSPADIEVSGFRSYAAFDTYAYFVDSSPTTGASTVFLSHSIFNGRPKTVNCSITEYSVYPEPAP